jgi:hypothetical protein
MDELQKQFAYYVAHQDELVERYRDRWVVLAAERVAGDFDSEADAYEFAMQEFEPGTFMIQIVEPGAENYSQTFHSRIVI